MVEAVRPVRKTWSAQGWQVIIAQLVGVFLHCFSEAQKRELGTRGSYATTHIIIAREEPAFAWAKVSDEDQ